MKKRQITKKETGKSVLKEISQEKRDKMLGILINLPDYRPSNDIDDLIEEVEKNGMTKEFNELFYKASITMGLDTHMPIAQSVGKHHSTFLMQVVKSIEKEYDCKTPSEKALAELAASAYLRVVQFSRKLNIMTDEPGNLFHEKVQLLCLFSKELDRAHRQYTNAILTLKQIKSPTLEVNVKAKNAFVGQNQQFNASGCSDKQNEINDQQ